MNRRNVYDKIIWYLINIPVVTTELRTAFGLLDRDRDGRVTAGELQHMLTNLRIDVSSELLTELLAQASASGECKTT